MFVVNLIHSFSWILCNTDAVCSLEKCTKRIFCQSGAELMTSPRWSVPVSLWRGWIYFHAMMFLHLHLWELYIYSLLVEKKKPLLGQRVRQISSICPLSTTWWISCKLLIVAFQTVSVCFGGKATERDHSVPKESILNWNHVTRSIIIWCFLSNNTKSLMQKTFLYWSKSNLKVKSFSCSN